MFCSADESKVVAWSEPATTPKENIELPRTDRRVLLTFFAGFRGSELQDHQRRELIKTTELCAESGTSLWSSVSRTTAEVGITNKKQLARTPTLTSNSILIADNTPPIPVFYRQLTAQITS